MKESASISKASLLGWILVLIVLIPIGYVGVHVVSSDRALQSGGVTIDLKTELVEEVRSAQSKTADEIKSLKEELKADLGSAGVGGKDSETTKTLEAIQESLAGLEGEQFSAEAKKITEALAALGQTVESIRNEQRALAESLANAPSPPSEPVIAPGTRPDTLNKTIFFPLAVSEGAVIDEQLAAALPEMKDYVAGRSCKANVFGFSDTLGNDSSNLVLSRSRADTVAKSLKEAGMTVGVVKGWGERWLDEFTKDGIKNDRNRRVVIELDCTEKPEVTASAPSS